MSHTKNFIDIECVRKSAFKDDVYSFGMTLYELITYDLDFKKRKNYMDVYGYLCHETNNKELSTIVGLMLE
jgi:hypothetical protein